MTPFIAALMLCISPVSPLQSKTTLVDLVEVNHFYDDKGDLVFDQVIFYDWTPKESRYNVRAWRLVKDFKPFPDRVWFDKVGREGGVVPAKYPERAGAGYAWRCHWEDAGTWRIVIAASHRETWTQYDPELTEREFLPKEKRKEL